MYHLIYEIKNKTNGKIYIGKHSTKDPKDKYMGSGTMIKKAIEEEGIDKFKKTILEFCKDEKCQSKKELEWIKRLNTTDPEIGYNLIDTDYFNSGYCKKL